MEQAKKVVRRDAMFAEPGCAQAPSRARARVVYKRGDKSPDSNLTDKPRVRAPAREGAASCGQGERAKDCLDEKVFRPWRIKTFGGDFNPIRVAVDEAVREFGSPKDTNLWLWYAYRIGLDNFRDRYFEQKSKIKDWQHRGFRVRHLASAFHAKLKRCYREMYPEGGLQ